MDQAERDHIQHELEIAANELFPRWIRRVELLQHDDAPMIEPGQLMPRLVFGDPVGSHADPRKVAKHGRTFKMAVGPGLNQFRGHLLARWPEIRYIEVMTEDDSGQRTGGNVRFGEDGREASDGEFTHVMVRLKAAELDIVDTQSPQPGTTAESSLTRVRQTRNSCFRTSGGGRGIRTHEQGHPY
jgi:hypothetical protein